MRLGINIDHIATLRNARCAQEPNVIQAALLCEKCGADGITTHLREDRRHIKDDDVFELKKVLKTPLNLEMAATFEMQEIALKLKPTACCIVPEKRQELTTEGGLDVVSKLNYLKDFVEPLVKTNIQVSMFIDADMEQINAVKKIGAQYIELHTGQYSLKFGTKDEEKEFRKLYDAAMYATSLEIGVNAGHGLDYLNTYRMKEIPVLDELNIGHSIIAKSIFVGLPNAIQQMQDIIK